MPIAYKTCSKCHRTTDIQYFPLSGNPWDVKMECPYCKYKNIDIKDCILEIENPAVYVRRAYEVLDNLIEEFGEKEYWDFHSKWWVSVKYNEVFGKRLTLEEKLLRIVDNGYYDYDDVKKVYIASYFCVDYGAPYNVEECESYEEAEKFLLREKIVPIPISEIWESLKYYRGD